MAGLHAGERTVVCRHVFDTARPLHAFANAGDRWIATCSEDCLAARGGDDAQTLRMDEARLDGVPLDDLVQIPVDCVATRTGGLGWTLGHRAFGCDLAPLAGYVVLEPGELRGRYHCILRSGTGLIASRFWDGVAFLPLWAGREDAEAYRKGLPMLTRWRSRTEPMVAHDIVAACREDGLNFACVHEGDQRWRAHIVDPVMRVE